MLSAVPWTRITGSGCDAVGRQGRLAPGGGGVAAPAVADQARTPRMAMTIVVERMAPDYPHDTVRTIISIAIIL